MSKKRRILAIFGEPASGKSVIARRLLAAMGGVRACPEGDPNGGTSIRRAADGVRGHYSERYDLWMLGRYGVRKKSDDDVRLCSHVMPEYTMRATRGHVDKYGLPLDPTGARMYVDTEVYEGVDRLSRSCQPEAERHVRQSDSNLFVEGDRLSRASFFRVLLDQRERGALVNVVYLRVSEDVLAERRARRHDDFGEEFLAPVRTRYLNIRAELGDDVTVLPCDTPRQGAAVWRHVAKHLGVKP